MLAAASLAVSPTETLTRADPLALGVALPVARSTAAFLAAALLAGALLAIDFFGVALLTGRFGREAFADFREAGVTAFLFDFFAFLAI
jgi:hypothetical protein